VNHVPDEVTAAMERFGEAILADEPGSVDVALKSDVRVRIDWDRDDLVAGTAWIEFVVDHPNPADSLRGFGPFLDTRVDGVETTLAEWGVRTPDDYERVPGADPADSDGDGATYAGRLRFVG
jgi:hypothetical protein